MTYFCNIVKIITTDGLAIQGAYIYIYMPIYIYIYIHIAIISHSIDLVLPEFLDNSTKRVICSFRNARARRLVVITGTTKLTPYHFFNVTAILLGSGSRMRHILVTDPPVSCTDFENVVGYKDISSNGHSEAYRVVK